MNDQLAMQLAKASAGTLGKCRMGWSFGQQDVPHSRALIARTSIKRAPNLQKQPYVHKQIRI